MFVGVTSVCSRDASDSNKRLLYPQPHWARGVTSGCSMDAHCLSKHPHYPQHHYLMYLAVQEVLLHRLSVVTATCSGNAGPSFKHLHYPQPHWAVLATDGCSINARHLRKSEFPQRTSLLIGARSAGYKWYHPQEISTAILIQRGQPATAVSHRDGLATLSQIIPRPNKYQIHRCAPYFHGAS